MAKQRKNGGCIPVTSSNAAALPEAALFGGEIDGSSTAPIDTTEMLFTNVYCMILHVH